MPSTLASSEIDIRESTFALQRNLINQLFQIAMIKVIQAFSAIRFASQLQSSWMNSARLLIKMLNLPGETVSSQNPASTSVNGLAIRKTR